MLIKLIAIYVDEQIIYKNMIFSKKNHWFPEYLNKQSLHQLVKFVSNKHNVIQQLQGEIGCKPQNASSTCKENPFCCTPFIERSAVTVAGMAGGKHKRNRKGGAPTDESPIKLVLNIKYEKDNNDNDKTIVLTIINNEITTDISALPADMFGMIKKYLEEDIRSILKSFSLNNNFNILTKAIENAIGICNLYYIINKKFATEEITNLKKLLNTNTSYNEQVKNQILRFFNNTTDNKNVFIKQLFEFFQTTSEDILSTALIKDPEFFSQSPKIYMSLVAFYEIYKVIKNLIDNTIDKCLTCLFKNNYFEANFWFGTRDMEEDDNYIFSAAGEMINNLRDDDDNTFFIEFESIDITIHYIYKTKMFKIFKTYKPDEELFNGEEEKNKDGFKKVINGIKNDAVKKALINISHMIRFENLKFYIPYDVRDADKILFDEFINVANTNLTKITKIISGIQSKQDGGASKKIRLNDYTVINGRKHVLYKGPRGGLYVLIKGKFKHV